MSGLSSTTGLISGLNTSQIIQQLLAVEGRPKTLAQQRIVQLQGQQAAFLDLNGRLGTLRTAAAKFKLDKVFQTSLATSTNAEVLTATASAGAPVGTYSFIVDRLVGTQQVLSRGFVDRNSSSVGATSITFESNLGRLDRNIELSQLNGGEGASRGKVVVTDSSGASATIDLSRAATVDEVLEALNSNATVRVSASVSGDKFVIADAAGGGGTLQIRDAVGYTTATSLGIAGDAVGGTLTGQAVYTIGDATSIQSLNDGNGIRFNTAAGSSTIDFTINTRDGSTYGVDIGDMYDSAGVKSASAVANFGALRQRILDQTEGKVTLGTSGDGRSLTLVDASTPTGTDDFEVVGASGAAADLGLVTTTSTGTITGSAVFAGLNSTLASNLTGGAGLASGEFTITTRNGALHTFTVPTGGSVSDLLAAIGTGTGGLVSASLDSTGTKIKLTDSSVGGGNLIVGGAGATALGLATDPGGVAAATVTGTRLQHQYIASSTLLSSLNGGAGIGTGQFRITDTTGAQKTIDIGSDARTIDDVVKEINSLVPGITARINDNGDGIMLEQNPSGPSGNVKIKVEDLGGTVARNLNLVGEASGTGAENFINGSFERTVTLTAGDTLDDVVTKINAARAGVTASVIQDGSSSTPFRLRLSSQLSGAAGAFTIDSAGADLGLTTIAEGRNSRVFFGSDDPARAILVSSTTNTVGGLIEGLSLDLHGISDDPVSIAVTRDTEAVETAVNAFVTAFNDIITRIDTLTSYDQETERKGTLLGDSTAQSLRSALFSAVQRPARGVSGPYQRLSQVGVKFDGTGNLTLDQDKLRQALAADPQGVADLFAASVVETRPTETEILPGITTTNTDPLTYQSLGVAEQLAQIIDGYVNSTNGQLTRRTRTIDDQIELQNDRIERFDIQLAAKRAKLERQFATLESTLASLQQQQGAISSLATLAARTALG